MKKILALIGLLSMLIFAVGCNNKTVTLVFETNSDEVIEKIELTENTILPIPTKEGYEFSQWYVDQEFLELFILQDYLDLQKTTTITLYAKWIPIVYSITYLLDGGDNALQNPPIYTIENEIPLQSPIKNGYTFVGWYDNPSYSGSPITTIASGTTGNITLYAKWAYIKYSISFNSNGGSLVDAINQDYNTTIAEPNPPTKAGYRFAGWYSDVDLTNAYTFSTMPASNITLYAKWELTNYSITYEDIFDLTNPNPQNYNIETATITLQNLDNMTGFDFAGWYTQRNEGQKVEEITSGSTGNITLYARWKESIYTITYENTFAQTHSNPTTYTLNSQKITLENLSNRPGYKFVGWYNLAVGGEKIEAIQSGSIGNKVLYARWQKETYTITYKNTNQANNPNPITYTIEDDTINLNNLELTGATFLGWYSKENDGELVKSITKGSTGNITLYARWEIIVYKVTYQNTFDVENSNPTTYSQTNNIDLLALENRLGYKFIGWYDQAEGGNKITSTSGKTGDLALYARWELITYNIDYREFWGSNPNPTTYTIETETIILQNLPDVYEETFAGWYIFKNGQWEKIEQIPKGSSGNIVIYGKYEYIIHNITYIDTYDLENNNPTTFTCKDSIDLEDLGNRPGYTFVGWYNSKTGGYKVTYIEYETRDITLYARWKAITYTISYILNDGENNPSNPSTYTIETLNPETSKILLLSPSKKGLIELKNYTHHGDGLCTVTREITTYEFAGWYKEEEFTNEVNEITIELENITLYAKWEAQKNNQTTQEYAYKIKERLILDPITGLRRIYKITMGEYPQTIKASNVTINENIIDERGYYLGSDGFYYAKHMATRPIYENNNTYKFSNDELIVRYQTYYFKVEPIVWNVLQDLSYTNRLFVVSDSPLDIHNFRAHDGRVTPYAKSNYEHSDIRVWLNDEFYYKAFSDLERKFIGLTLVNNGAETTRDPDNQYTCNNTYDRVFLLSYQDVVKNVNNGFPEDWYQTSVARKKIPNDYLKVRGQTDIEGIKWWTRSPYNSANISFVNYDGSLMSSGYLAQGSFDSSFCVLPALVLKFG